MPDLIRDYPIPDDRDLTDVLAALHQRCQVGEGPWRSTEHRFYDSFDWRVFSAGAMLEERVDAEGARLIWQDLDGEDEPLEQDSDQAPGLLSDLPEGCVRASLAPVLGIRRLLPIATVVAREQTLFLKEKGEGVARATVLVGEVQEPGRQRCAPLGPRLRIELTAGRPAARKAFIEWLEGHLRLRRTAIPEPLMVAALRAIGRRPGDYSSKMSFKLDGHARTDESLKIILRQLLEILEANISGAKAHLDPEFLHDLRVATRRTRSALGQVKDAFPAESLQRYRDGFAWLQQVTGEARDLDVYLQSLDDYLASIPAALRCDLAPLEAFLVDRHTLAQRQLTKVLESEQFERLIADWRAFLEESAPEEAVPPSAKCPLKGTADASIWRLYRRVRKEGRAIGPESPPPQLHELRKSAKKLRYLMEFFRRLYPSHEIGSLIKLSKVLLDNLGQFQDLAVQAQFLRETAHQMRREEGVDTDAMLAMGALIGSLLQRQQRARDEFADTFARFDTKATRASFRRLFKPAS